MYLQEVTIKSVKCFARIHIDFRSTSTDDCEVRRWTALLGQNGLGKSTLLQCLAAVLAGPGAMRELVPVVEGWVRQDSGYGQIDAVLLWGEGDSQLPRWPKKSPYQVRLLVTGTDPDLLPAELPDPMRPTVPSILEWTGPDTNPKAKELATKDINRLKKTAYAEGKDGWLACGYGPFRRLSGGSQEADRILYSGRRAARFVTLFREDAALTSATEWLIERHNTARENDPASQRALEVVKIAFRKRFLLEPAELIVDARSALLQVGDLTPLPFKNLSDGYRSMLALGIDLIRWLIEAFPRSADPLQERGVVLIDELDAHLHPRWQQHIGRWLLDKFPRLQFIVATHSPFLAQIADAGGNILLRDGHDGVRAEQDDRSVAAWRADQVLTEIFGLQATRPPDVQERLERYFTLSVAARKGTASEEEIRQLGQLEIEFQDLPEPLEEAAVRDLAASLRDAVLRRKTELSDVE